MPRISRFGPRTYDFLGKLGNYLRSLPRGQKTRLAQTLGISPSVLSKYLRGKARPDLEIALHLQELMNIPPQKEASLLPQKPAQQT